MINKQAFDKVGSPVSLGARACREIRFGGAYGKNCLHDLQTRVVYLFPFRGMSLWAQFIGEILPITHFLRIARGDMLKGMGFEDLARELWPIALFAVVTLWIGVGRYRKKLD